MGRRKIVLLGTVVFAAASTACATAPSLGFLIAARVVQGVCASMLWGTSLSIVSHAFSRERRGVGIGVWTGVGTIGQSIGPLIAGVFTTSLSWRWFFVVNVPPAIAGIVLTLVFVKESTDPAADRVDWPGFAAVTAALVFGIAVTGLVFKTFENDGYEEATTAAGGSLSSSELGEVRGLLSGSDEAAESLAELSPPVASQVEDVVRSAFTDGLRAAFVFNAVVALLGAVGALIGRSRKPPEEEQVVIPSPYHSIPIATTAQMTIGT